MAKYVRPPQFEKAPAIRHFAMEWIDVSSRRAFTYYKGKLGLVRNPKPPTLPDY